MRITDSAGNDIHLGPGMKNAAFDMLTLAQRVRYSVECRPYTEREMNEPGYGFCDQLFLAISSKGDDNWMHTTFASVDADHNAAMSSDDIFTIMIMLAKSLSTDENLTGSRQAFCSAILSASEHLMKVETRK